MNTVFSVVAGDGDVQRLNAYLYSHTAVVASATVGRHTAYLLRTDADDADRANYLVEYQVGRLESGLYARKACGVSATAALNALKHWVAEWANIDEPAIA